MLGLLSEFAFCQLIFVPLVLLRLSFASCANVLLIYIIIMTLLGVPHGVEKMSVEIPGLVETSSNLAAVHTEDTVIKVVTSQRSSVVSELHALAEKVEAVLFLGSFDVEHHGEYPGWKPNLQSRILEHCVASYRKLFGKDPEVKAIHAGLECGLFLEKFPDLDMISFGPTLRGVHAPGEKLELASLDKFVAHLNDVVTTLLCPSGGRDDQFSL